MDLGIFNYSFYEGQDGTVKNIYKPQKVILSRSHFGKWASNRAKSPDVVRSPQVNPQSAPTHEAAWLAQVSYYQLHRVVATVRVELVSDGLKIAFGLYSCEAVETICSWVCACLFPLSIRV